MYKNLAIQDNLIKELERFNPCFNGTMYKNYK